VGDIILQASLALLAAALAGWFAVQTYYQQREYELIITRYLEGGIDLLAAEVEQVVAVFNHNWARCLSILGSYRDLEGDFDLAELDKGFVELQSSNLNVIGHHKLFTLVGTHEYWTVYQSAMAFFTSANAVLVKQIPDVIRMKLTTTRIAQPHAEVVEQGFQEAKQQQDQSHKYAQLAAEFQILSATLESERVRFKKLKDFRKKAEVRESLARLKETFREELSENAADAQQMVPADVPASASLRQGRR
jgi:hypothetical protein